MEKKTNNNLESRSLKIRTIIGHVPNKLTKFGLSTIMFCILSTLAVLYFLPYHTYKEYCIELYSNPEFIIKYAPINGRINYIPRDSIQVGDSLFTISNYSKKSIEKSPLSGSIIYSIANNTNVYINDAICKIIPSHVIDIYGIVKLDNTFVNEIKINQKVILYLDNDPKKKMYDGYISKIYPSTNINKSHQIKINFETKIYDKHKFVKINSMSGKVKIILTDKPILKRILHL